MSTTTTSTERPPARNRTPEETPAAIARTIAALATAPVRDFGAVLDDDDRDKLWQRLEARVTADSPNAWSTVKEDDVEERLAASLATDEDRTLFTEYINHCLDRRTIAESAAFLIGREVGRQAAQCPDVGTINTPEPVSTEDVLP